MFRLRVIVLLLATAAGVAPLLSACDPSDAQQPEGPPPPSVSVAEVAARDVTQWDEFTGRVEAVESVEIRPRVAGYIEKVSFDEGQEVTKGQVLFVIDQRPYRAELARAEAELARARSQAALAATEVARAKSLHDARAISQEEYDQRIAADAQGGASIRAAEAAVAIAKLNLEFTEVRAPISGRAGQALVTEGNLVNTGASLLTTVVSLDPVYVYFESDEQVYLGYNALARSGERSNQRDASIPVLVGLANENGFPHEGRMDFVDNRVNPATGTIRARAVLSNAERTFTPGLYARVKLPGSAKAQALLVDEKAILTDQDRKYVYVLGPEDKAVRKDVKLGRSADGLRIVSDGLSPGDKVIVHGVQKVFFSGMPVLPETVRMGEGPRPQGSAKPQTVSSSAAGDQESRT